MTTIQDLRWGDCVAFVYGGMLIDDGMFITVENQGEATCKEPSVGYPRLRLMFAGSIFGRFEISKITDLRKVVR